MSTSKSLLLAGIASLALPALPLHAQTGDGPTAQAQPTPSQPQPAPGDSGSNDQGEIVVIADRIPGSVVTAQPPIVELDEEDIAAYGSSSIADLVAAMAPQTGSGRGRGSGPPVILVNGLRISSFRELRSYPPEAIRKVEVLPEEVAQKYGYSPDQRLINIILKDHFSSRAVEAAYGQPWDGGYQKDRLEGSYLRIDGPTRLNFETKWNKTGQLTEGDRGVIQSPGSIPDLPTDPNPAFYRTLVPGSSTLEATANWTTKLGEGGSSLSLNATVESDRTTSLSGLNAVRLTDPNGNSLLRTFGADHPLQNRNQSDTYSFGSTLNLPLGGWQFTATVDANHGRSVTEIDRYADTSGLVAQAAAGALAIDGPLPAITDPGFDTAHSLTDSIDSQATLIGQPLMLPGGEVSLTVNSGYKWNRIQSEDTRNPGVQTDLARSRVYGGLNLGIPLTSRREGFGDFLGDLSLNLAGGVDQLSDFGTLTNWSAGLNWGITEKLNLQTSYVARDAAPSLSQLGNPQVVTLNVPVYDFTTSQTVLASITSGGNPNLSKQQQRDWKVGLYWDLPLFSRSNVSVEYFRNHSANVSASFPLLTPAVEAAFADRVTRDSSGALLAIDQRPVTFADQNSSRLRFGINLSGEIKGKGQAGGEGGSSRGGTGGAGGRSGFAGGGGPFPGGAAPARDAGSGPPAPAGAAGGAGGGRGGFFDPAQFAAMRQHLCATDAKGQPAPDVSALPEPMQARLRDDQGQIDPARLATMRERVCSMDPNAPPGQGQPGGFDPARFAAIREQLCVEPKPGAPATEPDLSGLPEQLLARLKGDDGKIDPAKLAAFKQRVCSAEAGRFAGGPGGTPPAGGPAGPGGAPPDGARGPGAGGPPRGGPGMMFGRGGGGGGRWFVNASYTRELDNTVLIAPGVPLLNLLDGDALSGGGVTRDSADLVGGMFYNGLGLRFTGKWSGPSRINGTGQPGSSDLRFGSLATLDLRLFLDLGRQEKLVAAHPFFKGVRLSFDIDNIFDSRRTVTDQSGAVPLRYQPYLQDPTGRYFEIELRKLF